ncbi:hypothetical protein CPHO_05520 [Corynebacterium phocae]|uniref:HTH tetR-type domain-containing protein n=1 Tax=Corynebacterium phocae TaxID=161895 RepID=A0A1L7D2V6_9CORY|nr:TetR/AcrR family transcriptional regulator [Corynebacterium phocae]APT92430.1 hypothetical protein CPHO_05520 [Corynebacterium phocae]KAA8725031.1 TetR/AcrR family transcriptional regulator [Corynebacterium phocae]
MRQDALRRRKAIIAAATTLIRAHGSAVALEKVAEHAGVGIATVYRNFPDKHSLIIACSAHLAHEFLAFQDATIAGMNAETAAASVRAYADKLLDMGLGALVPALAPTNLDDLSKELRDTRDALLERGEEFITLGKKYGQIAPGVTHWQFIVGLLALTRPRKVNVDVYEPDLSSSMVKIYLAGLKSVAR